MARCMYFQDTISMGTSSSNLSKSKSTPECLRLLLAQAGSSLSLLCLLLVVKVVLLQLLSQPRSPQQVVVVQEEPSHRRDLRHSLKLLQQSPDCSSLLQCIEDDLISVDLVDNDDADDDQKWVAACQENYRGCERQGLMHHVDKILEALEDTD